MSDELEPIPEKQVVRAAIENASRVIENVIATASNHGGIVDEEGKPVKEDVVHIIVATTLASLYAVVAGLTKEKFLTGMEMTFEHVEESFSEAEELMEQLKQLEKTQGENKWVQ